MAPKRKRGAAEAEKAAEEALRAELASASLPDIAREWLAKRSEMKEVTERTGALRKGIKTISKVLAERMIQERVETVTVDDETLIRSKDVMLSKD